MISCGEKEETRRENNSPPGRRQRRRSKDHEGRPYQDAYDRSESNGRESKQLQEGRRKNDDATHNESQNED